MGAVKDKPKKVKKTKEKPKKVKEEKAIPEIDIVFAEIAKDMDFVFRELTLITEWVSELETKLNKISRRMGL